MCLIVFITFLFIRQFIDKTIIIKLPSICQWSMGTILYSNDRKICRWLSYLRSLKSWNTNLNKYLQDYLPNIQILGSILQSNIPEMYALIAVQHFYANKIVKIPGESQVL